MIYVIDLFCGAGGTTTGINQCRILRKRSTKVIACINHDPVAIRSHKANHPECIHFTEDIRTFDLSLLMPLVRQIRAQDQDAVFCLWASLECTNFSIAKGGKPRDADSRTLAEHLYRYILAIEPEYIKIENVKEFMSWGPLDENGKPLSRDKGKDFIKWINHIKAYDYQYEHRLINAADLGAYTSRLRYFACFAKPGLPIVWPEQTHAKKPGTGTMMKGLRKWKAVKEVLDLDDKGKSIFNRKKPLSEKTLARVYAGLVKFVAGGKDAFMLKYNSMNRNGSHTPPSVDAPCPTISTQGRLGIVQPAFISKYYSGKPEGKNIPITGPAGTIRTSDGQAIVSTEFIAQAYSGQPEHKVISTDRPARSLTATGGNQSLVSPQFITAYYSSGKNWHSVDSPAPTIRTKDGASLINPQFMLSDFTCISNKSIEEPCGSLLGIPKQRLVTAQPFLVDQNYNSTAHTIEQPAKTILACRKNQYLVNPAWGGNNGSVDHPSPVIVARQDKAPLSIVSAETGESLITINEDDTHYTRLIKEFMILFGIVDIYMRMLKISELLPIQGFPKGYVLEGTQTDQKKFIGNSVHPLVARKWFRATSTALYKMKRIKLAA